MKDLSVPDLMFSLCGEPAQGTLDLHPPEGEKMTTPKLRKARDLALAQFRLRAEVLLEHYDKKLTGAERADLVRVASAPREDDGQLLASFDSLLAADDP